MLIAGDDEEAKRKVSELVSDGGLRPLDVPALPNPPGRTRLSLG